MKGIVKIVVVLFLIMIPLQVFCQAKKVIRGFNLQTENDLFSRLLETNLDKDYSGGFHIELFTDYLNWRIPIIPKNTRESREGDSIGYVNYNSIYFQGMGFTPERDQFAQAKPTPGSRPYASLIGLGLRRVAIWNRESFEVGKYFRNHPFSVETNIFIGIIGADGPGNLQNWIHSNNGSNHVYGWPSQIANGGKPAIKYKIQPTLTLYQIAGKNADNWILNPINLYLRAHTTVGTVFNNVGGAFIIGTRDLTSTSIHKILGSQNLTQRNFEKKVNSNFVTADRRPKFKVTIEGYVAPQVVISNALLEGYPVNDNSEYTIPSSEVKRLVTDIGAKLVISIPICNTYWIVYGDVVKRSKEFSTHTTHTFGNIGITMFLIE